MKKKIILFDFDGVIADSFEMAFSVNKIITKNINKDDYRKLFDGNINDWKKRTKLSEEETHRIDTEFFKLYDPLMKKIRTTKGIKIVIKKLGKNYILIIISSTISSPIHDFMDRHNLSLFFDKIMGNDVHNSKCEKIRMIFDEYKIKPDDCILITDTLGDIREAATMKVKSIGVTWGFQKKENLLKGNPFRIAEKPRDLNSIVSEYFDRK